MGNICVNIEMDYLILLIFLVNIIVNMVGIEREFWLKYFLKIGFDIYKVFLGYDWEIRRGKMFGFLSIVKYLVEKIEEINSV